MKGREGQTKLIADRAEPTQGREGQTMLRAKRAKTYSRKRGPAQNQGRNGQNKQKTVKDRINLNQGH